MIKESWKHYGTPWSMWQELGITRKTLLCPSSDTKGIGEDDDTPKSPAIKGAYAWVAGVQHSFNWTFSYPRTNGMGQRVPAMRLRDGALSARPLAADIVTIGEQPWANWAVKAEVNHGVVPYVNAQNILFADGHVEREVEYYDKSLDDLGFQYNRWFGPPGPLILWYWGTGE